MQCTRVHVDSTVYVSLLLRHARPRYCKEYLSEGGKAAVPPVILQHKEEADTIPQPCNLDYSCIRLLVSIATNGVGNTSEH